MFEHLNFVVVLIKPWNLGGVKVNGDWYPQVRLGTLNNGIQTWKGDDITSLSVRGYVCNMHLLLGSKLVMKAIHNGQCHRFIRLCQRQKFL